MQTYATVDMKDETGRFGFGSDGTVTYATFDEAYAAAEAAAADKIADAGGESWRTEIFVIDDAGDQLLVASIEFDETERAQAEREELERDEIAAQAAIRRSWL